MKRNTNFYIKVLTLYLLIFISFLAKSYTKPNFAMLLSVVQQSHMLSAIPEILERTIPHQAR